jgi:hypothetical protein
MNNFTREKPENSAMTTVNILGRLRMATEQVREIQTSLMKDGKYSLENESIRGLFFCHLGRAEHIEILGNVGRELDGKFYFCCI